MVSDCFLLSVPDNDFYFSRRSSVSGTLFSVFRYFLVLHRVIIRHLTDFTRIFTMKSNGSGDSNAIIPGIDILRVW